MSPQSPPLSTALHPSPTPTSTSWSLINADRSGHAMHSSISACTQSSLFSFASRASNSREQRCLRRQRRAGDGVNKSATTATIITMPAPHHNGKPSSLTARATRRQKASAVDLESEHGRPVADRAHRGERSIYSPADKTNNIAASGMLTHTSACHGRPQWHFSLLHRAVKSVYQLTVAP